MTINIEKRDLFTIPQGYYLAHCISADFSLGAGIAKKFDKVYDMSFKLFRDYPDYYESYEDNGEALLVDNVFNLVTKKKYYHKPTYDSLTNALVDMKNMCECFNITKLAMPKIASGLDKLDWDKVYDIILDVFNDTDINIVICEF